MGKPAPRDPDAVRAMFGSVARRYDLTNHLMTWGLDYFWRLRAVELAGVPLRCRALDCACGTGDLAFLLKRKVGPLGRVDAVDFSEEMLRIAQHKGRHYGLEVHWQLADMLALPFKDDQFTAATIGFGLRNLADPVRGISEMARVVHPGGSVIVLEMGQARKPWLRVLQRWYMGQVVTRLGGWLTGNAKAYRDFYMTTSQFPCGKEFVGLMGGTGAFSHISAFPLVGGMVYIYAASVK